MGKYTTLPQNAPLEQKLASYTLNGECWEYNGCTDSDGYCQIMVDKKLRYAHRLSWEFHNGRQIPKGMTIDHICFNRKCINPKHLRLSSPASNSARHGATRLKTICDKHGCRRKIIWRWKAKRKKLVRESVCPECQREAVRKSIRKRRERNHE